MPIINIRNEIRNLVSEIQPLDHIERQHIDFVIDWIQSDQDIAEYGQALLLSPTGGEDRQEMYQQFTDMFEQNGVVDIAFKTDEKLALGMDENG